MELKPGDFVLCTVARIEGAIVFLNIIGNGQGSMPMSEVAAGRIRNLRDYVSLNKEIVCKVLSVERDNVVLSLRRVTAKERVYVFEQHQKEKTFLSIIKAVVKNSDNAIAEIKKRHNLADFFDSLKQQPSLIYPFVTKQEAEKLTALLQEKRDKEKTVKQAFFLKSFAPTGLADTKSILEHKEADIRYLGSSQFSIALSAPDFKEANHKLSEILKAIEQKAKDKKMQFEVKEAK